jgi:hypothetical protein
MHAAIFSASLRAGIRTEIAPGSFAAAVETSGQAITFHTTIASANPEIARQL